MVCPADELSALCNKIEVSAESPFGWTGPLEPQHISTRLLGLQEESQHGDAEVLSQPTGTAPSGLYLCDDVDISFSRSSQGRLRVRVQTMKTSMRLLTMASWTVMRLTRSPANRKGIVYSIIPAPTQRVLL